MRCDIVVVGGELEAHIAALRAAEGGAHVRLLRSGVGSLHYAGGGIGVYCSADASMSCYAAIDNLGEHHPYQIVGQDNTRRAITWFIDWLSARQLNHIVRESNLSAIAAGGTNIPLYAIPRDLATEDRLVGRKVAVVDFEEYIDGLPHLCASELSTRGHVVATVRVAPPTSGDSLRLARAFDRADPADFDRVKSALPNNVDLVLFPAVLGLDRHAETVALARQILDVDVAELPTLPPSVMGLRLERALKAALKAARVDIHDDVRSLRAIWNDGRCVSLIDEHGLPYDASSYIAANGGILMGGLAVDPSGRITDTVFGADVLQTDPLSQPMTNSVPDALHRCGLEVDDELRPLVGGRRAQNLFVTGAQLAHFNPSAEISGEGVAIATAYRAAEQALRSLGR